MKAKAIHHDMLDVCIMQLEDEDDALKRMNAHGLMIEALDIAEDESPCPGQVS